MTSLLKRALAGVMMFLRGGTAMWVVVGAGLALSGIGIFAIDLASASGDTLSTRTIRQIIYLFAGLLGGVTIAACPNGIVRRFGWPAMAVVTGLLVFLLLPGVPRWLVSPQNGARSWITLGSVNIQPSELAKVAFVVIVASHLRFGSSHRRFLGLLPLGLLAIVPVSLITLQPDLGTASLFIPALFAMLVAAGARLRHLGVIVLIAALAAPASYPLLHPHQKARLRGMVLALGEGQQGAADINFQRYTAERIAGAGELGGLSQEESRALVRYNALPEAHTDMVYAVIVNRFGLVGGLGVLALYACWITGALWISATCRDPFGRLAVVGCATFIAAQMTINIGMTIGLVPIIGITLPFVSFGGSSLVTVWVMTGLIVGVALRRGKPPYRPAFEYAHDPSIRPSERKRTLVE